MHRLAGVSLYKKPCSACGDARSCSTCQATLDCAECTTTARCGACRTVLFKARRSAPSIDSSAASPQGKRPRRLVLELAAELDRLELPRDKSGLDVYYQMVAGATSAVHKGGVRWFIDVGGVWNRCTLLCHPRSAATAPACRSPVARSCPPHDWPTNVRMLMS